MGNHDKFFLFWAIRIVWKWNNDVNKFGKKNRIFKFSFIVNKKNSIFKFSIIVFDLKLSKSAIIANVYIL